jgi:membrane-bound metal-dependent hydrolase YbcI (DUF457 family)
MLPLGHAAAGFLTTYGVVHAASAPFTPAETNMLLIAGAALGVIPDIDLIPFFFSHRSMRLQKNDTHRKYLTHAPFVWLILGLILAYTASNPFFRVLGLLVWFAPWSHFLGDSIEYGVRWLWPFSLRYWAFFSRPEHGLVDDKKLLSHYWRFIRVYCTRSKTFPLELAVILSALGVFLINNQ